MTGFNKRKEPSTKPGSHWSKIKDEEKTAALTPDKMDRTGKVKGEKAPYPLTEEEATPTTPKSEKKSTV